MKHSYAVIILFFFVGSSLQLKANIITKKLNDVKNFFSDLKKANAEFDQALKGHQINIIKNCSQEIDALKKTAEKIQKINQFTNPTLYNLFLTEKEQLKEAYETCIREKCKDTQEKFDQARKEIIPKMRKLLTGIVCTIIGTYCTFKFGPMIARKIARIPLEPYINELIAKYALSNTEHTKNALALCMRQQNKKHIPTLPSSIGLWNTPTIKALAEAFYGVELITENPFLFQIFENELHEQRSTFY